MKVSYSVLNAQTGNVIVGDSITLPSTDAFSVEQNVAEGTVKALQLKLRPDEETALKLHGTDRPEAYHYYLQARGYLLDYSKPENVDNAVLMAREALKVDPNFGMAKAVLGESYWRKYTDTKQKQWIIPAQSNCNDAVKLGNAGAAGHICLGVIDDSTGRYQEAESEFQTALGLEPTNEHATRQLAVAYQHEGKIAEAEKTLFSKPSKPTPIARFPTTISARFMLAATSSKKRSRCTTTPSGSLPIGTLHIPMSA